MTTRIKNEDPLLTIDEAAAYLNTTRRWIKRSIYEKRLRKTKLGGGVRIKKSVLDEYVEAQTASER